MHSGIHCNTNCKTCSNNEFQRNIKIKIEKQERSCEAMWDNTETHFKKSSNFYLAWTFLNSGPNFLKNYTLLFSENRKIIILLLYPTNASQNVDWW